MVNQEISTQWSAHYRASQFQTLVRRRRAIGAGLFAVTALFYFSVFLIAAAHPGFWRVQVFGAINLGLLYALLQYPLGGLVAYGYARAMRRVDTMAAGVVAQPPDA